MASPQNRVSASSDATSMAERYNRDGFLLIEDAIPLELIQRVSRTMDAMEKEPMYAHLTPTQLRKMDNRHIDTQAIHELASHPAIGKLAAAITGAELVQVFVTQSLLKPPGTPGVSDETGIGNVGWHQDLQYWSPVFRGELFTAWVAVSDVTADSGPMRFVRGSHKWGLLNAGDFFSGNLNALKTGLLAKHGQGAVWEEVPAILKPGSLSFHHGLTIHGSGPNRSAGPRKSIAIHLRTERSALVEGVKFGDVGWLNDFADNNACPIVYRAAAGAGSAR